MQSFSAIVGPNGSGKSNVIDSMLFVFGYRANKIRSKKISVLIHSSTKHQNINSCSVAVYFQKINDTGVSSNIKTFFYFNTYQVNYGGLVEMKFIVIFHLTYLIILLVSLGNENDSLKKLNQFVMKKVLEFFIGQVKS